MDTTLTPIGIVRSSLKRLEECPKQGDEGAPEAWVEIFTNFSRGLDSLAEGQMITLATWLHEADRNCLTVHPRGDTSLPQRGVFNTRSPDRPNPLGLHAVRILEIKGNMLRVFPLEALDNTPIVDIKSSRIQRSGEDDLRIDWGHGIPNHEADTLREICYRGWKRHLFSGFNGNVSIRMDDRCLITSTGSAKGNLRVGDLAVMDIETGNVLTGESPSSESGMHLEIYRNQPEAQSIVHTHPPKLLALGVHVKNVDILKLPIFESDLIREHLGFAPDHAPGSHALARDAGIAARKHKAIYLERHGLACWGESAAWALSLSEEIEHLAGIHLDVYMSKN